jgi:glycine/D-amino acid oxidase-like deaminating enzyme
VNGRPHVAVVGAGAFGGWTALSLLERGARVTLLDAWGAGNPRSSSGDESRILRGIYGPDRLYIEWVARALPVWKEVERRFGVRLFVPQTALWMFGVDDAYARASLPHLADCGIPAVEMGVAEAAARYPAIRFDGVRTVFLEEQAGYLLARKACRIVTRAVAARGGTVVEAAVRPGRTAGGEMAELALAGGGTLSADAYVFACGPWLPELFPEAVGGAIRPTRQEIYYFGTPPGDPRFAPGALPVWMDFGERIVYGIPDSGGRGFKVADDTRGGPFEPTGGDRTLTPSLLAEARARMGYRFPALRGAPLLEGRVCQYENSLDGSLLIDRHPEAANAWIVGGGSGHGFKLGPTLGAEVADAVLAGAPPPHLARFGLGRFAVSDGSGGRDGPGGSAAGGANGQPPLRTQFSPA